jgi:hypothetical protein
MRADLHGTRNERIGANLPMPPGAPPPSATAQPWELDSDPQEVWSALEDLWLRLKGLGMLSVEVGASGTCLVVSGLRRIDRLERGLRAVVLDVETYQARRGHRVWAFVQTLRYRGSDLLCELTPPERIARWSEGIDGVSLSWQVRGLVARLKSAQ